VSPDFGRRLGIIRLARACRSGIYAPWDTKSPPG
jgi:hypothetical protein